MFAVHEISQAVRTRRMELGLSQKAVAQLASLSRATIYQVEAGTIKDLSLTRTAALLEALGLSLTICPVHPRLQPHGPSESRPLELAAQTATAADAERLTPSALGVALAIADVAPKFEPQVATLLSEAPMSLLAQVVEQIHAEAEISRTVVWANLNALAKRLNVARDIWNVGP